MKTNTITSRTFRGLSTIALAALAVASVSTPLARAAITQSNASGDKSGFTVSATDLVNQGQSTLSSATRSHAPMHGNVGDVGYDASNSGTAVKYANDGQIGDFSTSPWGKNVEWYPSTQFGWPTAGALLPVTYTFALNTTLNPNGYDITGVTSTCGYLWNKDWLANQVFQVEITKDGSTWVNLGTYTYKPYTAPTESAKMTQVGLSNTGGGALDNGTNVAKNVTGIRITYVDPGNASGSDFNGTAIKEIDVVGAPSAALVVDSATSTVTASPASVASDGVTPSTITVTLKDAGGTPVPGKTVTLASSRGATDTISAASGPSNGSGVVTFTVKSSTPGSPTFTATDVTDSSLVISPSTATVTFTSNAVSAATSTVAASPATATADGTTTSTITVTLRDATSNPLSGKTVTLAKDSGPGSPVIAPASVGSDVTDSSGIATFTVTSTTVGEDVFKATETGDNITVTQMATVTFTAGAVDGGTSTVAASPVTVAADGIAASTVTVTLRDPNNNPVAGKTVTLASNRGATDTISAASGLSSASGVVTFTVTSTTVGSPVFTTTGDSVPITATTTVTFAPLTIVQSNASGDASGFTVSATDLVNQGQATLTSATRSHVPLHSTAGDFGGYDPNNTGLDVPYANDGAIGAFSTSPWGKNVEYFPMTSPTSAYPLPVTYTFTLNTALHPDGYDISGVTSTCGYLWNKDWAANQVVQVEITKNGSTWISLGTYTYKPYTTGTESAKVSQVVLTNTGGGALNNGTDVAKNVRAIRITYSDPGNYGDFNGTAIKEIDVFGQASTGGATSNYASWAGSHGLTDPTNPNHVGSDGLTNLLVYALDLKTDGTNGSPGTLTGNQISFIKRDDAVTNNDVTYSIDISADLGVSDAWHPATGVVESTSSPYTISYTLPSDPGGKLFARLVVTQK